MKKSAMVHVPSAVVSAIHPMMSLVGDACAGWHDYARFRLVVGWDGEYGGTHVPAKAVLMLQMSFCIALSCLLLVLDYLNCPRFRIAVQTMEQ